MLPGCLKPFAKFDSAVDSLTSMSSEQTGTSWHSWNRLSIHLLNTAGAEATFNGNLLYLKKSLFVDIHQFTGLPNFIDRTI